METNNLFVDYQNKKAVVRNLAKTALNKCWISADEYNSIIAKLDKDVLTVGVIGQIKTGKSTFLNALAFKDEVLPVASSTMTSSLTVITYGDEKDVVAEFYSHEEWEEIKVEASSELLDESDSFSRERIKAAKELVESAGKLGCEIDKLLGTVKQDSLENLTQYVGAEGRYVPITKSVTVHYPEEWLKNVEIVDTPGFNDPIVSREARTQRFLMDADAVVMLIHAEKAFDINDKSILFEKLRNVGTGKILIGINHFDSNYVNGRPPEESEAYVREQLSIACNAQPDSFVSDLLRSVNPVAFSAQMALMARMPFGSLTKNPDLMTHYQEDCQLFSVSSQAQMFDKSRYGLFENQVKELLENSKYEILINKPVNRILQSGIAVMEAIDMKLSSTGLALKAASEPDEDIEETLKKFRKIKRRVDMKSDFFFEDLEEGLGDILDQTEKAIDGIVDSARERCIKLVDNTRFLKSVDTWKIGDIINTMQKRDLPNLEKRMRSSMTSKAKSLSNNFDSEVNGILDDILDERDQIQEEFRLMVKKNLTSVKSKKIETGPEPKKYPSNWVWRKKTGRKDVDAFFDETDFYYIIHDLEDVKKTIIDESTKSVSTAFMDDIISKIKEAEDSKEDRLTLIDRYKKEIESLKEERVATEVQIEEMKAALGK